MTGHNLSITGDIWGVYNKRIKNRINMYVSMNHKVEHRRMIYDYIEGMFRLHKLGMHPSTYWERLEVQEKQNKIKTLALIQDIRLPNSVNLFIPLVTILE